jgi:hypothetical protein
MLGQTIPLKSAAAQKAPRAERRAGARSVCDAAVLFQPLTTKGSHWRPARIRNISLRNVGLAMDPGVPCGTILSVKLEGPHRRFRRPLIARVTRAMERPGEGYHVGCTFVLPLSDEELQALLSSAQPRPTLSAPSKQESAAKEDDRSADEHDPFLHGSASERRCSPRRRVAIPVHLSYDSIHAETIHGLAIDSSKMGLGLLAARPFAKGTVLRVRPAKADGRTVASVRVKVMCCRAQQRRWVIGVRFLLPPSADTLLIFG